jgi:pimeloyl-ACP methyl ester carboxylesterase
MKYRVPLIVTSENFVFNISNFQNDFDLIDLVTDYVRKDANTSFHFIAGEKNETAEYLISGTFCSPKKPSGHEKTVLLATHGIAYDGRYWDSSYKPSEYSFVEAMVAKGYSIFFYDRLGTGRSQK